MTWVEPSATMMSGPLPAARAVLSAGNSVWICLRVSSTWMSLWLLLNGVTK